MEFEKNTEVRKEVQTFEDEMKSKVQNMLMNQEL